MLKKIDWPTVIGVSVGAIVGLSFAFLFCVAVFHHMLGVEGIFNYFVLPLVILAVVIGAWAYIEENNIKRQRQRERQRAAIQKEKILDDAADKKSVPVWGSLKYWSD